jgi:hypothetical protein
MGVDLDSSSRAFKFSPVYSNLFIQHAVYPTGGNQDAQFSIALNGSTITWSACVGSSVIFNIFDPKTLKPLLNSTGLIILDQYAIQCVVTILSIVLNPLPAEKMQWISLTNLYPMDIMSWYERFMILVILIGHLQYGQVIPLCTGHNNSLYHRLKDQGLAIDSFNHPRTFIFIFKKNDAANYQPVSFYQKDL